MTELLEVPAEQVRPVRAEVLRQGQPPERLVYPGDDAPGTLHLAALASLPRATPGGVVAEALVAGIATVMSDPHPREPLPGDWRVRGMATLPAFRGRGIGAALLAGCEQHVRGQGGARVWCNARVPALGFYERAGWLVESDVFEVEDIGPHVVMSKLLG